MVEWNRERWRRPQGSRRGGDFGGDRAPGRRGAGGYVKVGFFWPTRKRRLLAGRVLPDAYQQLWRLLSACREEGGELSLFLWRSEQNDGWRYSLSMAVSQPRDGGGPSRGRPAGRYADDELDDEPDDDGGYDEFDDNGNHERPATEGKAT